MTKIFEWNGTQGTLIDSVSKTKGTLTAGNGGFKKTEKGLAMEFDGSATIFTHTDPVLTGTGDFTIETWFKFDTSTSTDNIVGNYGGSNLGGFQLGVNNSNQLIIYIGSGVFGTTTLQAGRYYHGMVTRESGAITIYMNNISDNTGTLASSITGSSNVAIGADPGGTEYFDGNVARVRIYDTALTSQQRNDLYEEFLHSYGTTEQKRNFTYPVPSDLSNEEGLVAAYNMIPSNGTLVDISGNGNTGTINGALSTKDGMSFDGSNDTVTITNTTLQDIGLSDLTYVCRFKNTGAVSEDYMFGNGSMGGGNTVGVTMPANGTIRTRPFGVSSSTTTINGLDDGLWHTFVHTIDRSGNATMYIDTINVLETDISSQSATSLNTGSWYIGSESGSSAWWNGDFSDAKVYTGLWTQEQIVNYHNSFKTPTLIESFENNGADGIVKTPRGWTKGTGDFFIDEYVIEQGELVTNGGFDTDSDWDKGTGWTISGGQATYTEQATGTNSSISQNITLTQNKRYRLSWDVISKTVSSDIALRIFSSNLWTELASLDCSVGSHVFEFNTDVGGGEESFQIRTSGNLFSNGDNIVIDNVSITEISPLPNINTGTKLLECDSDGTVATQSKQAYGTWEFDMYKGADGNQMDVNFMSTNTDGYVSGNTGYNVRFHADESISLRKTFIGSKFTTATAYFEHSTWYRLKIARLQSEGVFKDIPTLQESDMTEGGSFDYVTFTSNGRYGFSAVGDGDGYEGASTADEITIVNTEKYLVEFDLDLRSGTTPNFKFSESVGGSGRSNGPIAVNGRNSEILTATASGTFILEFNNYNHATNYTISGLTIRRIYDADTFAVFIKGGEFGDQYQLVDTTGGSGSNPVTDSTYTTSQYLVTDLDSGDKISNIKITDGVKQ